MESFLGGWYCVGHDPNKSGEGYLQLVQHVHLAVSACSPCDDLVLARGLELDELGIAEEGAAESRVGIVGGDAGEIAGDDMVGDEISELVSVRRDARLVNCKAVNGKSSGVRQTTHMQYHWGRIERRGHHSRAG